MIVSVQIATRIHFRVSTDSTKRERDSGATFNSPEVNCRPPLGSQKGGTVDEVIVFVQIASRIQSRVWRDSFEWERDF